MTEWLPILTDALKDEYDKRPAVATLATVDQAGAPHARSIVCRQMDGERIVLVSDRRSAKNVQLRHDARAEMVFWLAKQRVQFRLAGEIEIGTDAAVWKSLSDASRSLFFWPTPGSPRDRADADFLAGVSVDTEMPASFEVLTLRPVRVERLDLNTHPHARRRWERTGSHVSAGAPWVGIDINP